MNSQNDVPSCVRGTPIEELIRSQNFSDSEPVCEEPLELIVGLFIDRQKQFRLARNCAYVISGPGTNMRDCEFTIAFGLSTGIKYMALIVHDSAIIPDRLKRKEDFVRTLTQAHSWTRESAMSFFDRRADDIEIKPIDFALAESQRLSNLFSGLFVVPLICDVEKDCRLFLISEWLSQQIQVEVED